MWRHPKYGVLYDGTELYFNDMAGRGHNEDNDIALAMGPPPPLPRVSVDYTTNIRLRRSQRQLYGIELSVAFAEVENGGRKTWARFSICSQLGACICLGPDQ